MENTGTSTVSERSAPTAAAASPGSAIPLPVRRSLAGLLLLFVSLRVVGPIRDPDTYWHITAGEHLARTWDFVLPDPWGAAASRPWILNQWLPELLMSWFEDRLGLAGVAWLASMASTVVVATVWWTCRKRASMLSAVVLAAIATLAMMASLSPRPQLVTFALAAVTVDAWLQTAQDGKARWWLIGLSWLWACSHGMWFVGVIIALAVITGMIFDGVWPRRQLGRLALIPLLSFTAAALTPVGPRLLASPVQVAQVTRYITEWQPPLPTSPNFLAVLVLLAVPVLTGLRSRLRTPWHVLFLLGLALALALLYIRTLPLAAVIAAPLAAHALGRLLPSEQVRSREKVLTAALASAGLVVSALLASGVATQPGSGPNDLDGAIGALPTGTVLCNDWRDGGWLIWKHPNVRVTMDSRVEIYSAEHIKSYGAFLQAAPGWEKYPTSQHCSYALLPTDLPVIQALISQLHWTTVATGTGSTLLRAPD